MKKISKILKPLFTVIAILFGIVITYAQSISNRGKEFWVSYGHHQSMNDGGGNMDMVLYLSTDAQPAVVDVEIIGPGNPAIPATIWRRRYNIPAFTAISTGTTPAVAPVAPYTTGTTTAAGVGPSPMPKSGTYDCRLYSAPPPVGWGGAGKYKRAIRITSNVPIVAYSHIYDGANSGASMLLPIEAWGYTYVSLNSYQDYTSDCFNWTYIIAKDNDTKVQITPSVKTRAQDKTGLQPGVASVITLQRGEVYQLVGANDAADANGNGGTSLTGKNLSGTKIQSLPGLDGTCKPIAVFAGSSRTTNPISCGSGGGDNDNQQLFPEHTWGTTYLTVPFSGNTTLPAFSTCSYRIAVSDPTTVVKRNGVTLTGLQNNNFYFFESSTPDYIEADKPIMMCQFMTGGSCIPGSVGDPEMITLSPMRQAVNSTRFYRNDKYAIVANFLTIALPTGGLASLKIDGVSINNIPVNDKYVGPHPNKAGYSIVTKRWTGASGQSVATCDSAFTGIVYGEGSVESYGYNAGTNLDPYKITNGSYNTPDTSNISTVHPYGFLNIPMYIGVNLPFKATEIVWKLTQTTPAGHLSVIPPPLTDVTQTNPTPLDSSIINGEWHYLYRLPNQYTFDAIGIYHIPLKVTFNNQPDPFGCFYGNVLDFILDIEIKALPTITFTYNQPVTCDTASPVNFTSPSVTPQGYNIIKWHWEFTSNPGDTSNLQNPTFIFPTAGTYTVKLTITTQYGGLTTYIKTITVNPGAQPHSIFTITPTTLCLGEQITATPTSNITGTTEWYWDFGDGTTKSITSNAVQTHTYTATGSYVVKHTLAGTGSGYPCPADTVKITVVVAETPVIDSAKAVSPTTCTGPSDGEIYLYGLSANANYEVKYTDINNNVVTVNITADANGIVKISNLPVGTYKNISTKIGSCISNEIASAQITYPSAPNTPTITANSEFCSGNTINLSASSTTTGVSYEWTGPNGFTSNQQNPSITNATTAASGTYSVTAVLNGCVSTATTKNIVVNLTPNITNSNSNNTTSCNSSTGSIVLEGLEPNKSFLVKYTKGSTVDSATLTSSATGVITIASLSAGTYNNVTVKAGVCISNVVGPFTINDPAPPATPVVTNNSPLCADATINLTSSTTTAGVTYAWSGPGGFTSNQQNVSITNSTTAMSGTYTIKVTLNNCESSASTNVVVNPNPIANFNLPDFVCMPGNPAKFTNTSTIASGTLSYLWNFGDGSPTSTAENPSHVYATSNTYNVKLTATSNAGCSKQVSKDFSAFYDKPIANFTVSPSELCQGNPNTFTDLSTAPNSTISNRYWNFGENNTWTNTTNTSLTKLYQNAGNYTVSLTVKNQQGCPSDTMRKQVKVYVQPVIDAGPPIIVPVGTIVQFNPIVNDSSSAITFKWSPATGLSNANILHPLLKVTQNINYVLKATGAGNCSATDTLIVKGLKPIIIPNAFSPNGDGINDTWVIENLNDYVNVSVEIFNRYGQLIYKTNNGYTTPWDGKVNGKPVPVGVYYYIIDFKGQYPNKSGSLTIIR
ncbi:MAG: PKD domain-containing protein [Chitinophagales bacterium]|nr:PKD domain-containing protein [Chitinophagales bacterium]